MRKPPSTERTVKARRYSGCSVSGSRNAVHMVMAKATIAIRTKIMCHSENSITSCPTDGAITGITMNTMNTSDMISAMARPPNTSRITETAMTRVDAAPIPCTKRSASNTPKVGASAAASAAAT